jgi:hypothetical protein
MKIHLKIRIITPPSLLLPHITVKMRIISSA